MAALRHCRVGVKEEVGAGCMGAPEHKPGPLSSRTLILGVSCRAKGHVSLISSVVRPVHSAWLLTWTPLLFVEQRREDAVKRTMTCSYSTNKPHSAMRRVTVAVWVGVRVGEGCHVGGLNSVAGTLEGKHNSHHSKHLLIRGRFTLMCQTYLSLPPFLV